MKRNLTSIILIAIIIVGLSLLLYPTVSDYINSKHQSAIVREYAAVSADMSKERSEQMIKAAQEYNEKLLIVTNPILHPDAVPGYKETLDVTSTGIMGYISIEKIGVELPVYHSVDEGVLQIAVGHLPGTSFPVSGKGTHSVLSGHRGLPSSLLFTDLDQMEVGDTFEINVLKEQYTYVVDQIKIILPDELEDLAIDKDKEYCTLMTCTPYGVNSHRLLVRGVRTEIAKEGEINYVTNEAYQIDPVVVMPVVAAPMFVLWIILLGIRMYRTEKKRRWKGIDN